ncbi:unnamed protein product [Urochloa decumbens]|uniref:NPH3 domain-containing protein n=1 Tax=Urochloa decumbens TaxID=240449 RepID=A0ABC9HBT2_9POAL
MSAASSMDRITQWVSTQEIPADLTIRIAHSIFPLHKAVMVPRCGYIRRAVAAATKDKDKDPSAASVELDLSAIPGGADAFEKVARYCYGANFEINARNAAALRCAAAFLDMADLPRRVDEFLAQAALPSAVAVLRSCEVLLPAAEELGVARRAADAVALRICNEALFPTRSSPPGWWAAELAALSPASFQKVATALRCRRAAPEVLAAAASAYAELALAEVLADPSQADQRALVESVVEVLPSGADAPIPAALLCRVLHAAVNSEASAKTCRDLELRVAAVLDQATAGDLFSVALDGAGERVRNADTVRRVVAAFVERQQAADSHQGERRNRRSSMSEAVDSSGKSAMEKVARMVDEVAAEMATEESLGISRFVGVAGAVPKEARACHDGVYRAVDIYLKTHPALDEIEREKVCSVMDPLKLSYQARLHASQNKRLPLQAVLSALYYDQLKLRSAISAGGSEDADDYDTRSAAEQARAQAMADASLARENEALRSELARMQAYVSGMQKQHSKGSASSRAASPAEKKKKASFAFLGSVSRTLSKLNPFRGGGWAIKDTASVADGGRHSSSNALQQHVVKPKRRRFSIS